MPSLIKKINLFCITCCVISTLLIIVGQMIRLNSLAEIKWFAFTAILSIPGLFIMNKYLKLLGISLLIATSFFTIFSVIQFKIELEKLDKITSTPIHLNTVSIVTCPLFTETQKCVVIKN